MSATEDAVTAPFVVQEITAEPGTIATGYCHVYVGPETLRLPVVVAHGKRPGPVLAVTAGIHGGEYVPIVAARRFVRSIDPEQLTGTIIVSLMSSPPSFAARQAFVNPLDDVNLNRSFPGAPDGGPTERLAHWLWVNVISRGDAYVDCHCGDLPEHLEGFTGVVESGDSQVNEIALALAGCFDVKRTITTSTSGSTIWAAAQASIPATLIELGGQGTWTADEVRIQAEGLTRIATHLGHLPQVTGTAVTPHPLFEVSAGVDATMQGLWFPMVSPGDPVVAGEVIGRIEDPFGDVLAEFTSPVEGIYVYGLSSLAVQEGDFLACFASPVRTQS